MLPRMIVGIAVAGAALIAAVMLILADTRAFQMAGLVVLAALVLASFASDWFGARSNERHVERYPHLLRNEVIGETVRANGDFEVANGVPRGVVILRGEQWKARCLEAYVPKDGEMMSVCKREGLTLYVQSRGVRE